MNRREKKAYLMKLATEAYFEARKGKRTTLDEFRFEVDESKNISDLVDSILDRTYRPSSSVAFVIREPVVREIFAAPFRDRVAHHIIIRLVMDWWDRQFIYDSYSCRKGKGTLVGIERLKYRIHKMKCDPKHRGEKVFVLKLDILGYFMSLPRDKLLETALNGLKKQFPKKGFEYKLCKFLWTEVIMNDATKGVRIRGSVEDWDDVPPTKSLFKQPKGQGIVIGNVTSQLLSNIYLNDFDHYVVGELGYQGRYGRYVDDFYIMFYESEYKKALSDLEKIREKLASKGLMLHPKKQHIYDTRKGVPFIGAVIYENHVLPGKRLKHNFIEACQKAGKSKKLRAWRPKEPGEYRRVDDEPYLIKRIISEIGHMSHFDSYNFIKSTLEKYGLMEALGSYIPKKPEKKSKKAKKAEKATKKDLDGAVEVSPREAARRNKDTKPTPPGRNAK
ncbi:RNA-directed DNA polymerase [Candidatus Saccharibacteria bacterium]|nr:RNA-directed DNA polymerase [Candidatus Saccharibacteria bacterium]